MATAPSPITNRSAASPVSGCRTSISIGSLAGSEAADAHVAADVDGEPGIPGQRPRREVGGEPLADAARVEHQAGRSADRAGIFEHLDRAPASLRGRPRGAPWRGCRERVVKRCRVQAVA